MVQSTQVADSIVPVLEELTQSDVSIALLGDNQAALAAVGQGAQGWRDRHLRMRAAAARERISAGVLSTTYVPGNLQVADVGTKPLPASRLLALLRMPPGEIRGPTAARFFGKLSALSTDGFGSLSPATLVVLALLMPVPTAQAVRLEGTAGGILLLTIGQVASGQPQGLYEEARSWLFWVPFGLSVVACVGFCGLMWVWEALRHLRSGRTLAVEEASQVSPRLRMERASGSNEEPAMPSPEPECVFPMVGRVDYRST